MNFTLKNELIKEQINRQTTMYSLVQKWFSPRKFSVNSFCDALLKDDVDSMKKYINDYLELSITSFESLNNTNSECFYHGIILGLLSDLRQNFIITSNQENEEGSYYVQVKSINREAFPDSYLFEFMVKNEEDKNLINTAENALMLITLNGYNRILRNEGFESKNIKEYGFAFEDKKCEILIQTAKRPKHPELAPPDFEFISDYAFREKEKVFVIDKNDFDIWEGIIIVIKNNEYAIHYPDYPTDDEDVEKERVLPCSHKNKIIFRHQEKQRQKILEIEEQNSVKKVKNEGAKRKKKHKKRY